MRSCKACWLGGAMMLGALLGCGDSGENTLGARSSGEAGAAGTSAGQSGAGGASGQGGEAGTSGQGGAGGGGTSGQGGSAGASGQGGASGVSGQGGASGASGQSGSSGTSGQSGASGASGQGGAAGQGGAPVACGALQVAGEAVTVAGGEGTALRNPRLAPVDGGTVGVGAGFEAVGIPGGTLPIGYATMAPWGSWPIAAPTLGQITFGGGSAFELGGGGGNLWLLSVTGAEVGGTGLGLLRLQGTAPPGDLVPIDALSKRPVFFSVSEDTMLAGGDLGGLLRASVVAGDKAEALQGSLGCGINAPLWAGSVRLPGGADLVMATSHNPPPVCDQFENVPQGSPTRILLYRRDGQALTLLHEKNEGTTITYAGLLPRSDGAWLLYQLGDSITAGALVAERLDAQGLPTGQTVEALGSGLLFSEPAVAAVGDRFALVWNDDLGQVPKLFIKVLGTDGATPPLLLSNDFSQTRRVLGAPDGQRALVAWEAEDAPAKLRLLRVDCAPEAQ